MKKIIKIARVELSNLFYSPIAWLLLCIFLVQCGVTYSDVVTSFLRKQRMASLFPGAPTSASFTILTDQYSGLFTLIVDKLYFYLPLITMGLISREVSSGSIRMLYSSPVKVSQIVLGKFLAMVYYNLLLVFVLGIFCAVACYMIPYAETGIVFSGLLAFFLLLCCYAAIGLFMSCLTSYQVVAALSTLALFAFLNYVGNIWQDIDFVRDLTYFLSMNSRVKDMFDGLLTSRDVLYFIIITVMFLGFSVLRLKADQEFKPGWIRALRYFSLFVVAVGLGYLTSRPAATAYWDVTKSKVNTLSPSTQALLKATGDEPLEMTAYVNLLDYRYSFGEKKARNAYLRIWEKYTRFKPINYNFYYYYDTTRSTAGMMERTYQGKTIKEVALDWVKMQKTNLSYFHTPEEARKLPITEDGEHKMIMELTYKGKKAPLRMYDDNQRWPFETHFQAALKRLMTPDSVQRVAFLEGQYQRDANLGGDRNYAFFSTYKANRGALTNNGFDILTIEEGQDIPNNLAVLIVADPKTAFSEDRLLKLRNYINTGGNLLITTEPGKRDVIKPLLQELDVDMQNGILVTKQVGEVPELFGVRVTPFAANMSKSMAFLLNARKPVAIQGAAALDFSAENAAGFTVEPMAITMNDNQWLKKGTLVSDSAMVEFNEDEGDVAGTFAPVISLSRTINGRDQRIIVAGDGDFINNLNLQKFKDENGAFLSGMFKWFSNGVFPIEISGLPIKDTKLELTDEGLDRQKILLLWILPAILGISGIVLLLRRKRK